jgi:hypothetical protein
VLAEGLRFLPLDGFYHFGYVTQDLDSALERLGATFGVARYRRRFNAPWMEVVHARTGGTQIEVSQFTSEAPQMYLDFIPDTPGEIRLQHLGYKVETLEKWDDLQNAIELHRLATPLNVSLMDGNLRAIYVDTCATLGFYLEYLYFSGPALRLGDDIPQIR